MSSNAELARCGFDAIARGDYAVIAQLLAPDVKWHGGDAAAGCQNRSEALAFIEAAARRGTPRLLDVIDAGDRVVVVLEPSGAGRAAGASRPRANVTTFRDGRVVEMVAFETVEAACAAAGVPPSSGARAWARARAQQA